MARGDATVKPNPVLDLAEIVEKASSLSERLGGSFTPEESINEENLADVEAKLQRWCATVARGDWENFKKRLSWDDLDLDSVRPMLGPVRIVNSQQLPGWIYTLNEALSNDSPALYSDGRRAEDRCLDSTAAIPFEELWLPFVRLARRRLSNRVGTHSHLLSSEAFAALERELLQTLASIGAQSLYVEFTVFQAFRQPFKLFDVMKPDDLNGSADITQDKPTTRLYLEFVQHMFDGGLPAFFHEYCVVGRLVSIVTDNWVDSTANFLNHLASDLPDIQQRIGEGVEPGSVVGITPGLSDPHRSGHSVLALKFASGLHLIYKPRDIGLEAAYNKLLAWINKQGVTPALKVLNVLNCPTHGWVEFVEHLPCQNEHEAALYYQRAGMLIGLFYLLHGSDCHSGNLIACGPHPIIIDVETLLYPNMAEEIQANEQDSVQILADQQFRNSVLTSGLLPMWEMEADGSTFDVSGFGGAVGQSYRRAQWRHINTDRMILEKQEAIAETSAVPYLNQVALSPGDYLEEMVAGFQQMYGFFLDHRLKLLAHDGPLAAFQHLRSRFVFRNTSLYNQLRLLSLAPKYMKDGVERSLYLDLVSWALVGSDAKPRFWPLLKEEVRALEQMDIPLFGMYVDEDAIRSEANQVVVADTFTDNGYHLTTSTLAHMNQSDMELQSGFIRASILSGSIRQTRWPVQAERPNLELGELAVLSPAQFVEEAIAIADTLLKSAIRSAKGLTWVTLDYTAELERYQLRPLGHSLYSGLSGVALFLGALAKATGEKSYGDQALAVINDLRSDLSRQDINRAARMGGRLGLGSAYGIGAVVYTLTRLSQFLDHDELLEDAHRAAALLTPELIASDRCPDLFSGSAGGILGLLALYEQSHHQNLLDQAVICGQHLLNTRVASASGHRAWVTLNDALLTGFSHGAAGIAYALLRLYERASDPRFLDAAREAIAYERSVFSAKDGNWPDYRVTGSKEPLFTASWCNGAPGIGLARLATLELLDSEEIRQDIEVALETTCHVLLTSAGVDHLCCGTLGRTETLIKAGQVLSRPELTEFALKVASSIVRMAEQRGSYHLFGALPGGIDNPGFFQGTSGIGYHFLRLANPELFPSVLLWE